MPVQKRGRTSLAELEAPKITALGPVPRLPPPHDLTDEEVEVWVAVVNDQPADHFTPSTGVMLAQLCRHVIASRRIAELIERAVGDSGLAIQDYDRLLHMQERESRAIASLSTKMRISQQSTTNHRGNKKPTLAKKPWEA